MDKSQEIHVGHIIFSSKWEWIAQRNKGIAKPHCLSSFLAPPPFFPFSTSPGRVVFAWQTDRDTCGTLHWAVAPLRGPNHFQTHTRARTQMVRSRNTAGVWPNLATLRTRYTGSENNEGGCCPLPLIQISALLHLPSLLMCIELCIRGIFSHCGIRFSILTLIFSPKTRWSYYRYRNQRLTTWRKDDHQIRGRLNPLHHSRMWGKLYYLWASVVQGGHLFRQPPPPKSYTIDLMIWRDDSLDGGEMNCLVIYLLCKSALQHTHVQDQKWIT